MTTQADSFAATLHRLGVTRVYGLPGEDHMTLLDAFATAGITYVGAYNESSAAIMAATDAQVHGGVGVVLLSLAPGVSNGLNGLLHAHLEQVPLLVISGQHEATRLPFVVRQGFDLDDILAPVTRWQVRVVSGSDMGTVLAKAAAVATGPIPGPVYVEFPDSVAKAPAVGPSDEAVDAFARMRAGRIRGSGAVGAPDDLARVRERLSGARRPALVVGGHAADLAPETVARFAEAYRCPVFTSSAQKGLLDEASPWYAGTFLNGKLEHTVLDQADVVVLVNASAFDFYNRPLGLSAHTIAVTADWSTEWILDLDERVVVDPEQFLAGSDPSGGASEWSTGEVADYRAHVLSTLVGDDGFSVAAAARTALAQWPTDGYLIADAGFSKPIVAMLSTPAVPGHYLASNALSTMGFSIPAAVAAAFADRPVLTFLGDGSLLMRVTELMVLRGTSAPVAFVAMMDGSLTQIEVKQEIRGLATVGVELPQVSCAALGQALGIAAVDVHSADELATAVKAAMNTPGPTLIGAYVATEPNKRIFEALRD